jgi:tRNA (guanine37-N1)-methyltransferase
MKFNVITIFPDIIHSYFTEGILKKAVDNEYIKINTINPRDFTTDKHQTVDDTPYGGGAGMLLKIDPLYKSLKSIKAKKGLKTKKVVLLSASGKKWNQKKAQEYSKLKELTLISGRYEGVDERIKEFIDEEISIGDYVLTGGELAALTIIDSTTRLIPSVLGNKESVIEESHNQAGIGEYPQYTRPETFKIGNKKLSVPKILLSGDHKKIKDWRDKKSKKLST